MLDAWHAADNVVDVLAKGSTWDGMGIGGGKGDAESTDAGVHEEDAAVKEGLLGRTDPSEASQSGEEVSVLSDMEGPEASEGVEEEDIPLIGIVEFERLDASAVLVEAVPVAFGWKAFEVLRRERREGMKGTSALSRAYLKGKDER